MVCLDTSFLIDVIHGKPLPKGFEDILDGEESVSIAAPTIVEIIKGLYLKRNLSYVTKEEKNKINETISSSIILSLDKESSILAGEIEAELINKGEFIDIEDIMIGAIAIRNKETLITRNKKHFEKIPNLKIESY